MQPQHSCGTLESRIKIFGCMVQELQITFYPLDPIPCYTEHVCTSKAFDASSIKLRPRRFQPITQNCNSSH